MSGRRRLRRSALPFATDARLARRAAGGDPAAFEEIFRRYQQDLYRFCVGILREPQDAQDAVQNTMIRAMRARPGETREMQLKPWLYRIAHNEAVELRRRERPVEPLSPTVDDAGAGTEERAEQDVRLQTLLADIADLPERQRATLVMRELNGLGFGEIGAALQTSPGAVRQALYEARRGLSQMESGRDMDCDAAMKQVSDADGSPTRRGIRAHLRGCVRCRRFQAEIRDRRETLAAVSPMPLIALAALAKGGLGGSAASGGAAATGGAGAGGVTAAGGSSAVAGGSSLAAGGAGAGAVGAGGAGALGLSGLVKATTGLIAALAVGTVAVDHGAILGSGQDPARPDARPAQVRGVEAAEIGAPGLVRHPVPGRHRAGAPADAATGPAIVAARPEGGSEVDAGAAARGGLATRTLPSAATLSAPGAESGVERGSGALTEMSPGPKSAATGIAGGAGQGADKAHPQPPRPADKTATAETKEREKSEARDQKDQAKTEKSEAKAVKTEERTQAKAVKTEERTQAKAVKTEAREHAKAVKADEHSQAKAERAEAKTERAEARSEGKAEKTEVKEHPAHPERGGSGTSNGATATGAPATAAPATTPAEPSAAPSEPPAAKEHPEHPEHPAHPEKTSAVESVVREVTDTTQEAVSSATAELLHGQAGR